MLQFKDLNVTDKRVLIRADLNVPLDDEQKITDANRIKQFIPTIRSVLERKGRAIVMSHLGRPEGAVVPALSLKPVAEKMRELLETEVKLAPDCIGTEVVKLVESLDTGQILLLENLRFRPEEKADDQAFAAQLASLGDVFVNDAFATAHRSHASMVGVPKFIEHKGPGLLMERELEYYERALVRPERPLCIILGGAKVSTKLNTLFNLSKMLDTLIIGGAMANTFLAAQGVQMGRSLYEPELFPKVLELLGTLARRECKMYLPVDFRIGNSPKSKGIARAVTAQEVPPDTMALDIGPASSILFSEAVTGAQTIVWNGPMGAFENEDYAQGTTDMTQTLAQAHGLTVVGGGDTDAAIHSMELEHKFDYISTGGGAFLMLMEGKTLPGIKALE